ncbi:MAG: hypothetical protein M1834_003390 [Cirrosporium novae-zelandiae]|nr:MAG: hypothetical protein M1834_003390 [Cirrosporium novae-zelandiae]
MLMLTALDATSHVHLIVGSNALAASRCVKSIGFGAIPIVITGEYLQLHHTLTEKAEDGKILLVKRDFHDSDLSKLGRKETDHVVDAVFLTIERSDPLSAHISKLCRRLRIPINVVDAPDLCTFTLLCTHSDGPLQIGITTSGNGCKLASRIRREIAASLPQNLGSAIDRLGRIRRRIWEEDQAPEVSCDTAPEVEDDDATAQKSNFNALVLSEDQNNMKNRRMRWLKQICEYRPLTELVRITDEGVDSVLAAYKSNSEISSLNEKIVSHTKKGKIILAGCGPGNPDLLTRATYKAIKAADIILADKLVPGPVLDLIPRRTKCEIARKFPGNADKAQEEFLSLALENLKAGRYVLRLKQGDPYLYGRGAEEFDFFRNEGYLPTVLPGITSAFSAPLFAGIPSTHRGAADRVLVCTGTGRKGVAPDLPSYNSNQTVVFLMALHRLDSLVESLTKESKGDEAIKAAWPLATPCAVIERASCPDQRIIRSTLEHVCAAVEQEGSRPPGLLVVGWNCGVLHKITGQNWVTEEGFGGFDDLEMEPDELKRLKEVEAWK